MQKLYKNFFGVQSFEYLNVNDNYKIAMVDRDNDERKKILDSVDTKTLFDKTESAIIEWNIDNIVKEAKEGKFKRYTVDRAPLRSQFLVFFVIKIMSFISGQSISLEKATPMEVSFRKEELEMRSCTREEKLTPSLTGLRNWSSSLLRNQVWSGVAGSTLL